ITYQPFDLRVSLPADAPPPTANTPPTVTVTTPIDGTQFIAPAAITLTADADDSAGTIQQVNFFSGSTFVGSATAPPYSFDWTNVAAGTYEVTATATDDSGEATTSSPVTVTVAAPNQAPHVTLTAPATTSFAAPATITVAANASDADDGVAQVEFFAGPKSIGVDTSAPYQATWATASAG